jgi:DNA-binding NarL/FixJ family response regulator
MQPQRKIIIADDHPLFRAALHQALYQSLGNLLFLEGESFDAVQELAAAHPDAELVLLDLHMPGANGLSGLVFLRGQHPALPVVVVSAHDEPALMYRAIDLGASGFIPKSTPLPELQSALRTVLDGDIWLPPSLPRPAPQQAADDQDLAQRLAALTPQQYRVFCLMADGLQNKQIASQMDVSEATVKAHVTAILRKLGVHSRTQALAVTRSLALDAGSGATPAAP